MLFIDDSKAFDTLWHDTLQECLHDSGVRIKLLEWCEVYLNSRKNMVEVGVVTSEPVTVTEGTAQG